jgi:hypothetical protein
MSWQEKLKQTADQLERNEILLSEALLLVSNVSRTKVCDAMMFVLNRELLGYEPCDQKELTKFNLRNWLNHRKIKGSWGEVAPSGVLVYKQIKSLDQAVFSMGAQQLESLLNGYFDITVFSSGSRRIIERTISESGCSGMNVIFDDPTSDSMKFVVNGIELARFYQGSIKSAVDLIRQLIASMSGSSLLLR